MYMPGRLRTASRPSRTWISAPPYSCSTGAVAAGVMGFSSLNSDIRISSPPSQNRKGMEVSRDSRVHEVLTVRVLVGVLAHQLRGPHPPLVLALLHLAVEELLHIPGILHA